MALCWLLGGAILLALSGQLRKQGRFAIAAVVESVGLR